MLPGVVFDSRWEGLHGIGRFAGEVRSRLPWPVARLTGHHPVSLLGMLEIDALSHRAARRAGATWFLSPGYTVPVTWRRHAAVTVHDLIHLDVAGEGDRLTRLYYERMLRPFLRRCDVVLTVSEFSRERILEWSDADPDDVVVIGNGVDLAFFGATPSPLTADHVLFVGNRKPHKNLPRLVHALSLMREPGVRLALTGTPDGDLLREAARHGVADRLDFLGVVPEAALPGVYAGARAVAIPSLYEGFGLPALEGMAAGVPVVASNVTALPEVVGDAGLTVDPYDVEALAAALDLAVGDPATRARAAERGPQTARLRTWDRVATRLVDAVTARS